MRYHASWGNPSEGEEVRDGPHNHNRGGGSCGGVAPATVPLLMPRAGALRGPGPSLCQGSSAVGRVTARLVERSIQAELRSGFHPLRPLPHLLSGRAEPIPSHPARPSRFVDATWGCFRTIIRLGICNPHRVSSENHHMDETLCPGPNALRRRRTACLSTA